MNEDRYQTVLLVDDDPVARSLTACVLASHQIAVVEAGSGDEALHLFPEVKPSCVVLDALMPQLDGFTTCERLRALKGSDQVPILMLTGLDDEESVSRAYEAGATDFFVKSQQWTLLAQRVRYLLRSARMHTELERSRSKLAKAQALARLGGWDWNLKSQKIMLSPEIVRMLGLPENSKFISQKLVADFFSQEDLERISAALQRLLRIKQTQSLELTLHSHNGKTLVVQCEAEIERVEGKRVMQISGTMQDITQRKEIELKIRALADYDTLTNLPNRRFFNERFADSIRLAERNSWKIALLFIDLDRFKQVNDSQGHSAGDALLMEVAHRLLTCVRMNRPILSDGAEDIVARFGGDEFAVLVNRVSDAAHPYTIARRILEQLREPFLVQGIENFVSASVGISMFPEDGRDVDTLLRNADAAMYSIKANGRNDVRNYHPELMLESRRRWQMEKDLHKALERNELELHYQPQVDARRGQIIGVEALMRWNRGGLLIGPVEFIPLAQETGLIIPMGEWAIRTACAHASAWIKAGYGDIGMAVNVPSAHIQRGNLAQCVRNALAASQFPAACFELEITETMLMQDLAQTIEMLVELSELGIRLSVDDFGTGYSSLAYLKRFPIDALKIDSSFIRELEAGSENEAIIQAIVALARTLKLKVIAEGVETCDQAVLLEQMGCSNMQGYWFSKPKRAEDIGRLLAQQLHEPAVPLLPHLPKFSAGESLVPHLRVIPSGSLR